MAISVLWVFMLLASVLAGLLCGTVSTLANAALAGANQGVTLALSIAGAICLWSGLAKVMEQSGLTEKLAGLFRPLLSRLFPQASRDPITLGYLSSNLTANLLGLGNAATPMGIEAVKRMQQLSAASAATDDMCLLIVMNTASIQLIPSTVAAVRGSLGAARAFDILPAVWLSSLVSVSCGILAARLLRKVWRT